MQRSYIDEAKDFYSPAVSKRCFGQILLTKEWRQYSSLHEKELDYWIDRFLLSHAKVPSLINTGKTMYVYAISPLSILRWRDGTMIARGALFSNGAVMLFSDSHETIEMLFIDDATAKLYNYPDTYVKQQEDSDD